MNTQMAASDENISAVMLIKFQFYIGNSLLPHPPKDTLER